MQGEKDQIVVTGVGMVCSLGLDAGTACAAARAGFSGAAELNFKITNLETNEPVPVVGHAVPLALKGFEGFGRLLRLAQLAINDLRENTHWSGLDAERAGLWLAMPSADRSSRAIAPPDAKVEYENAYLEQPIQFPDSATILKRFAGMITHGMLPDHLHLVHGGHASFAAGLEQARKQILGSELTHAILLGVDTLVESHTLQWLHDHGRLKSDDNPVGLMAGEAAVAVLLEPDGRARSRKAPLLASVPAIALSEDAQHLYTDKPPLGQGLAAAVAAVNDQLPDRLQSPWIISDHNGEVHRATDWGYALPRLISRIEALRAAIVTYPAIAFGDTGAASGGVALCSAVRSFARKYSPARSALVVSSSDSSERAAFCVQQAA
jgi:3-oxoacyl-[acyl-carrier-protein] synthase I